MPVARNGWGVKFSVYKGENILLTFISLYTGQTVIRYFTDEDDAVKYLNYITTQNPNETVDY